MGSVLSINVASARVVGRARTGIDKQPAAGPVRIQAPGGPRGVGSGVAGDTICNGKHHGGDDQAVYAYAREDLDRWEKERHRPLAAGVFGENLTTAGIDVTGAVIGERWRIGAEVVLQVSRPRIPCATFQNWMGEKGWIKRFTRAAVPGAYLRVAHPGLVAAGDGIEVVERPDHGVTIGEVFRALTLEPELLARLMPAGVLPERTGDEARPVTA
jgi:MOSC domain-containing protein YiiM